MQLEMWIHAALAGCAFAAGTVTNEVEKTGTIEGVVVNGTHGDSPASGAEVVLRIRLGNRSAVAATTTADRYGAFRFDNVPLGTQWVYLPGANHGTVHHPGPRVDLTEERPRARVQIAVYDEVSDATPLVIAKHTVVIQLEGELLKVSESLVVDNPSLTCYIGPPNGGNTDPITLHLALPDGVQRVTFEKEFFGRRFSLNGNRLVTSIPWPPGRREIAFQYAVPTQSGRAEWARRLDVPCSDLQLIVHTPEANQVDSNLKLACRDAGQVLYENESALPAGQRVYLVVRTAGVPLSVYGRWLSLAALLSLIVGAWSLLVVRKNHTSGAQ